MAYKIVDIFCFFWCYESNQAIYIQLCILAVEKCICSSINSSLWRGQEGVERIGSTFWWVFDEHFMHCWRVVLKLILWDKNCWTETHSYPRKEGSLSSIYSIFPLFFGCETQNIGLIVRSEWGLLSLFLYAFNILSCCSVGLVQTLWKLPKLVLISIHFFFSLFVKLRKIRSYIRSLN